jgi:hypothetical protein
VSAGRPDGDGLTSDDRNLLRAVASYGQVPVTAGEVSRNLGLPRQAASARAALLARLGFLESRVLAQGRCYAITDAGAAELKANEFTWLLVKVDDRMAGEVYSYLAAPGLVNGIAEVTDHGGGCCCKNCPWRGDHG